MPDQRVTRFAKLLVEYSLKAKPGERIAITGTTLAEPLMLELYRYILKAGAHPHLIPTFPSAQYIFFSEANDEQLNYISPFYRTVVEEFDGFIQLFSSANTRDLSNIEPVKQGVQSKAQAPLMKRYMQRHSTRDLRILITMFPTACLMLIFIVMIIQTTLA